MKKLLPLFLLSFIYINASIVGSSFSKRDIQILEDLDINSSYITDYKLQEVYELYQNKRNTKHYISKLNEASLFVPRVKDVLREKNIPDVFIYMAMAESNFLIDAKSNAKAMGLWQFMYSTGKRYGLKNDIYVDERMDLVKSTAAAADYLNALHDRFGKWYLAAIAYDCGEGRVVEALTRAIIDIYVEENPAEKKSDRIQDLRKVIKDYQDRKTSFYNLQKVYEEVLTWDIDVDLEYLLREQKGLDRQYLPRESRRYIRKIISLAMLNSKSFITNEENAHLLNIGISTTVATVPVKGGLHLKNVAKVIGMTYDELHALNKHLKQGIIPPYEKFYTINIPYSRLTIYNQNREDIPDTKFAVHIVSRGDTLYGIAKKHTVKSGDSLYSIAKKYNVQVKKLMQRNNMKNTLLKIGDRLVIK